MSRKYKVDELLAELTAEEVEEYKAILRQPAATIDDLMEWFAGKDCKVSRGAVWKHRRNYQDVLDGVKQSAELARAFGQVVRETGVTGMNDAIMGRFQQLQMEWAFTQLDGGALSPEDLERFAKSMNQAASAAQRNEDLRERFESAMKAIQARAEGRAGKSAITDDDIAEVRKAVFG
jgi:hypothetical protein